MHTLSIHIEDVVVSHRQLGAINSELLANPHVQGFVYNKRSPRDILIDVDGHHNMAMAVLDVMHQHGVHADVVGC